MVKNFEDMCNRLDTIPACDGQTDGQTDRRTDRRTNILPRHSPRYAYASCGKNLKSKAKAWTFVAEDKAKGFKDTVTREMIMCNTHDSLMG